MDSYLERIEDREFGTIDTPKIGIIYWVDGSNRKHLFPTGLMDLIGNIYFV